jgi:hypothetical protein
MNKVFFAILCVSSSFLCSMNNNPSTKLSTTQPDIIPVRHRMPSNPIARVKEQSLNSKQFTHDEYGPALKADIERHKIVVEDLSVNGKK